MEAVVQSIIHVVHHGSAEAEFQGRVLLFPTLEARNRAERRALFFTM